MNFKEFVLKKIPLTFSQGCTFHIYGLLKIQLRNCNVFAWDLCWSNATMFLFWSG